MKSQEQLEKKVEINFNVLDSIEEVKVNHFFKHKVLKALQNQKEEKPKVFIWFTPQLQWATLGLILLMNVSAVLYTFSSQEEASNMSLDNFAQEYSLQSETTSLSN